MDKLFRFEGRAGVQAVGDDIGVWGGDPADPVVFLIGREMAARLASEMLALAGDWTDTGGVAGVVDRISIEPPIDPSAFGRIGLETSAGRLDLAVGWTNLVALADIARRAVEAATAQGEA